MIFGKLSHKWATHSLHKAYFYVTQNRGCEICLREISAFASSHGSCCPFTRCTVCLQIKVQNSLTGTDLQSWLSRRKNAI